MNYYGVCCAEAWSPAILAYVHGPHPVLLGNFFELGSHENYKDYNLDQMMCG